MDDNGLFRVFMPSAQLAVRRLGPKDAEDFGVLVSLYQKAFPETEQKPVSVFRDMLEEDGYTFLLATEHDSIAGFSIARRLNGGTATLLEYMAVAPAKRDRGVGSQLFLATAQTVAAPPLALLMEVESDRIRDADQNRRKRLKRFYRALGAREVQDLRWIMPPQVATPPPPMDLLIFPGTTHVTRDQLQSWLTGIYTDVYGQSADHPRLREMLGCLPGEISLS